MAEQPEQEPENKTPQEVGEEGPGLLEHFGSFPVWMLKAIHAATPDFLISKNPPQKKKVRI